ncbi:MAG: class A beta-lactamase-related serine hydrolase [Chitinophagaceae bacterium]|nr:class A beta-lactamase-related serine hydrolase [Chitinophagaceae bacterium]
MPKIIRMKSFVTILFVFAALTVNAQKKFKSLEAAMVESVQQFNGDIGFYVEDLVSGKAIMYHADTIFPTASVVKVPILAGIMDKIEKGEFNYHQKLTYRDSLLYEGEDILGSFKDGEKIEISKVIMLMLTTSDNTASLWLQSLAGSGTTINELMNGLGLTHTRVNSRTPGREANRTQYGWGQTTPAEMAKLFKMIYRGEVISREASEKMIRLLGRNYWDEEGLSAVPAGVFVASKNGAVNASRSEVMIVNGKRPYIFSIFTKNNKDQSWEPTNEAWTLTRKLSAMVWNYFAQ